MVISKEEEKQIQLFNSLMNRKNFETKEWNNSKSI